VDGFGLLTYPTSHNLGDEIQSLAARRFLPRVDRLIDREALDADPDPAFGRMAMILNGWFMHRPRHWPPHPKIAPLLVSLHISPQKAEGRFQRLRPPIADMMLRKTGIGFLRRHGPIGARDRATEALLQAHGIEAYYSGCLTLTLTRDAAQERENIVVACDLPPDAIAALRTRTSSRLVEATHHDTETRDPERRLAKARELLSLYGRAKAVVTTRLHCALPSLALQTPVLFLPPDPSDPRVAPALSLARHCSLAAFVAGRDGFDFDTPAPNDPAYQALREALEHRCVSWREETVQRFASTHS
jgi:hypothetical protein